MKASYDTIIIGAGPAGIAAAETLLSRGKRSDFILLDKGKYERSRKNKHDVFNGVGGAALWSDGKVSFKPAGTGVWKLNHPESIKLGLQYVLQTFGIADEERLKDLEVEMAPIHTLDTVDEWVFKPYDSIYVPLEKRLEIIDKSYQALGEHFVGDVGVHYVSKEGNSYVIHYQVNGEYVKMERVRCRNLIIAGGRYLPLFLKLEGFGKKVFRRAEIGVRMSAPSNHPLWTRLVGTDPKYISRSITGKEYRTFCCCRGGEVVSGTYYGLETFSGRADCPPTGVSNIGFNMRSYKEEEFGEFSKLIHNLRLSKTKTWKDRTFSQMSNSKDISAGIASFCSEFAVNENDFTFSGPTVEGIGYYYDVDNNLKIPNERVWVIGDATGIFRGLTASMVSGVYAAAEVLKWKNYIIKNQIYDDVNFSQTWPKMTGAKSRALHEVHIFLEPINPTDEDVTKFNQAVEKYNRVFKPEKPMKACHLALEFVEPAGLVRVLQSSRFVLSDSTMEVVEQCHKDARFFSENEFTVVREKIEAVVFGTKGIPENAQEMSEFPTKYFEFHIRVEDKDGGELHGAYLDELIIASKKLSERLGVPIPFSYNKAKGADGMHQKYLNLRCRHIGSSEAMQQVDVVKEAIEAAGLVVAKIIAEYVWYDTFPLLDKGWIDF